VSSTLQLGRWGAASPLNLSRKSFVSLVLQIFLDESRRFLMGMYLVGRCGIEMTFSFVSQHAEYPFCLDSILCNIHTAVLHPPAGTPIVPTRIYIPRFASVAHSSMGSHDRNVESLAETSHMAPGLCRCVLRGGMGRNMLQIMDIGFERVGQGSRASAERVLDCQ